MGKRKGKRAEACSISRTSFRAASAARISFEILSCSAARHSSCGPPFLLPPGRRFACVIRLATSGSNTDPMQGTAMALP